MNRFASSTRRSWKNPPPADARLIQQEAHDEANIIFGSVVQEGLEDEIRVTVIATGLCDSARARRRRTLEDKIDNVTPLRPPIREEEEQLGGSAPDELANTTIETGAVQQDFISPFDEEYDVPAFIRKTRESV